MPAIEDALAEVRQLERDRLAATRSNDAASLASMLDEDLIYVSSTGVVFDKAGYLKAIETHELTYDGDLQINESDYRAYGDTVMLVGMMKGHARLDGEQLVFNRRYLSLWRHRGAGWALSAWQSSPIQPRPF